ncbi:MAG TPA: hypothetical protein PKC18_01895 [Lacipirellulaceae bacterium]|nr:hypothetical protein [Lacipirellulaceae bacterium]HMP04737.1 hypothetical protein [Lacipirellulaceae bacterium]
MATTHTKRDLPYRVKRILAKYEPTFRARLTFYLKQRAGAEPITWDDITESVSLVFGELTNGPPCFSSEVERQAIEDFEQGRCKTTREWADELRSNLA